MFNLVKNEVLFTVAVLNREKLFDQAEQEEAAKKVTESAQSEAPTSAYKSQVLQNYAATH
jgi:hypothetical protein